MRIASHQSEVLSKYAKWLKDTLFFFWPRNISLRSRDTAIREGSTQDRKLKPNSPQGPLGPGTLPPRVLTVSHQQAHKTGHPGQRAAALVSRRVRGCAMPHYEWQGQEVRRSRVQHCRRPPIPWAPAPDAGLTASHPATSWCLPNAPPSAAVAEPQLPGGNSLCLLRTLPAWVRLVCGPSVDLHLPSGPCLHFN